jgi:drug/metabolite transporter (DMT)-like permease
MEQMTFETMIAVFEEIFGRGVFWGMVAVACVVTGAYLYVLVRDRAMSMRKFMLAQLSMPFGAVAAVLFVQRMTHSHLRDVGGPVDVIVLLGVAGIGAIGAAILVYTAQSLFHGKDGQV